MVNKNIFFRASIILLVFGLVLIGISSRGCPKRSRDRGGSSEAWRINAPSALTATMISPFQINLSWNDNSNNEDGFAVERKMWSNGIWTEIGRTANNFYSDTDPALVSGATYYYRVRAYMISGEYSDYSNEASATLELIWTTVGAGGFHTSGRTPDGMLWSWGMNSNGQLGVGDTANRFAPAPAGIATDWLIIACGTFHSLGLKMDGTIWSWGANALGQLGMGDNDLENWEPFPIPRNGIIDPTIDSDWSQIAAKYTHSLALKTNGTLWAWGGNGYGELGLGDIVSRFTPTPVGNTSDWSVIQAGGGVPIAYEENIGYSIGRKINGTLWAWGFNGDGQLGLNDYLVRRTPAQIGLATDWSTMFSPASNHTLALKTNGTLWAWGANNTGQLGIGGGSRNSPTQVGNDTDWIAVAAGTFHSIALKNDNTLWTWGNMKIEIVLAVFILLGLVLFIGCSSQPTDQLASIIKDEPPSAEIETQYESAQKLFNQKKYQQCVSVLEPILADIKNRFQKEKTMFLLGESYFYLHWNDEADNLYSQYLTIFPETKKFDEILTRRYEIAFRFINGEKQKLLGLSILSATDKGIQLTRDLLKQFPYAPVSENYCLKLADYLYQNKNYDEARMEYDLFIQVYPQSNAIPLAQFRFAESYLTDYKGPEYDDTVLTKAQRLFSEFLEKYPSDGLVLEVKKKLVQIKSLKAQRYFIIGDYYLRTGENPAARIYLQEVITSYPETQWAQKAKELMATIKE